MGIMCLFVLLLSTALLGCSAERQPGSLFRSNGDSEVVVDATLIVGRPLADIFVRRTRDPGQSYSRALAAVTDAQVNIAQGAQTYAYRADPDSAGRYLPPADAPLVEPQTEYVLQVRLDDGAVCSRTTTPPPLQLREVVLLDEDAESALRRLKTFGELGDGVYSAPENQLVYPQGVLEFRLDRSDVPAYQLALFSLDPDSESLVDSDILEEDDIDDFERQGASPPLDVASGQVRLPWFAIGFAGRYLVKVYAVDQNWFDYARSNIDDDGPVFGGLAGDNFERPIFNVSGGIGLFGSAAVDSVGFFVLPRQGEL